MNEYLPRVLAAGGIIFLGLSVYWLVSRVMLFRANRKRFGLEDLLPGVPGLLENLEALENLPLEEKLKQEILVDNAKILIS